MRDVFVGVLFGTGAFLVGYRIAEVCLDNTASIIAGLGAMCLAWFSTKPQPAKEHPIPMPVQTPLQDHLHLDTVYHFHLGGAALFVGGLMAVSILFGVREGRQEPVKGKLSPTFWRWFHWTSTFFMLLGAVWIVATWAKDHRYTWRWDTFLGESTCALAFGLSWLLKGWEFDTLFHRPVASRRSPPTQGKPRVTAIADAGTLEPGSRASSVRRGGGRHTGGPT